jgi:hypothetical protein
VRALLKDCVMTFKPGQRVRYVGNACTEETAVALVGAEAVVHRAASRQQNWQWVIKGDALANGVARGDGLAPDEIFADADQLVPLTDPRAESFVTDMERYALLVKERNRIDVATLSPEDLAAITGGA